MVLDKISRNLFLFLSRNKILSNSAKKWGLKAGASQVVAGVTISSVIKVVKQLNEEGLVCTVDHLGEFVTSKEEAIEATSICIQTLEEIDKSSVNCNLSLKLTQLGLDIDRSFCLSNVNQIMKVAKRLDIFVRIDMEDYSRRKETLDILEELRKTYENVGTVIQAYLFCSNEDVNSLNGVSLRLVKGAYQESEEVAYQSKNQIDDNYIKIIKEHLITGSYTAIATHDHNIINKVKNLAIKHNIPKSQFEFQMLYGFRTNLQKEIVNEGYTMRVYVPYGKDWYGYFMRRLAERPQNITFALRGLLSK